MPKRKPVKATIFPDMGEPVEASVYMEVPNPEYGPISIEPETEESLPEAVEDLIHRSVASTIRRGHGEKYCPFRAGSKESARWLQLFTEHNKTINT